MDIKFRRISAKDREFLFEIFSSALAPEIAAMNWSAQQQETYLDHQFKAQHKSYQSKFPKADFQIILIDGEQAGRLYVDRRSDEIRIIDLVLLPQFRGQGIGTKLIGDLCTEAGEKGHGVGVHIPKGWRAMRLAHRLGFQRQLETEMTDFMLWRPGTILA